MYQSIKGCSCVKSCKTQIYRLFISKVRSLGRYARYEVVIMHLFSFVGCEILGITWIQYALLPLILQITSLEKSMTNQLTQRIVVLVGSHKLMIIYIYNSLGELSIVVLQQGLGLGRTQRFSARGQEKRQRRLKEGEW